MFAETTEESFDRVVGINTNGTFFMCQRFANLMIGYQAKGVEDYSPRIVNIASNSSYTSSTSRGEYCISKAGVSMTTLLFADKLAEYGIHQLSVVNEGIYRHLEVEKVPEKDVKLYVDNLMLYFEFLTKKRKEAAAMVRCRITVMRQVVHEDLMALYENPIEDACDMVVG